jgi:glycosyltransferase involved in cell wall biosynthesis
VRVSVIVPARDAEATIVETIRCVQSQTIADWELIVVDDHSDDATGASVLELFSSDRRVRLVRAQDRGVSSARNRGAAEAVGRSLVFLDADDLVHETWLERLTAPLEGDPSVGAVCCGATTVIDGGHEATEVPRRWGGLLGDETCLYLAGTYCLRPALFEEIGGFDTELAFGENTDLGIRVNRAMRSKGLKLITTDDTLLTYRLSTSRSVRRDALRLAATEHTLSQYRAELGNLPDAMARYHRIAAVTAWRIDERAAARHHARVALRTSWRDRASFTTMLGTHVPLLGRRWKRTPRPDDPVANR